MQESSNSYLSPPAFLNDPNKPRKIGYPLVRTRTLDRLTKPAATAVNFCKTQNRNRDCHLASKKLNA